MASDQATLPSSTLIFNGRPVWHNPAGAGHAFVKLRKDIHEEELIRRMWLRKCLRQVVEIASQ
jgi:hypothetical protein